MQNNVEYLTFQYKIALLNYHIFLQSLEFAPKPKEVDEDDDDEEKNNDMALAFANRSAVWNDRGEFALAIRDADFAFESNYPEELKHKLFERKGQCFASLGKTEAAKKCLQKSIDYLDRSNLKVKVMLLVLINN